MGILRECDRRACTAEQLAAHLHAPLPEILRSIQQLTRERLLYAETPSRIDGQLIRPYRTARPASTAACIT